MILSFRLEYHIFACYPIGYIFIYMLYKNNGYYKFSDERGSYKISDCLEDNPQT